MKGLLPAGPSSSAAAPEAAKPDQSTAAAPEAARTPDGASLSELSAPSFNRKQVDTGREVVANLTAGCKRLAGMLSTGLFWSVGATVNGAKAGRDQIVEKSTLAKRYFNERVEAVKEKCNLIVANLSKKTFDKGIRAVQKDIAAADLDPERSQALMKELGSRVEVIKDFIGRQLGSPEALSPVNQLRAWKFATRNLDSITDAMKSVIETEKAVHKLETSRTEQVVAAMKAIKNSGLSATSINAAIKELNSDLVELSERAFIQVRKGRPYAEGSRDERLAAERIVAEGLGDVLSEANDLIERAKAQAVVEAVTARLDAKRAKAKSAAA